MAISSAGHVSSNLFDGTGNAITSQINGDQRALDVGINVAGVQIDPRQIRALTSADVVTVDQGTSPWVENIAQFGGSAVSLGQKASTASIPVVLASDQSAIPVSQSGAWTVTATQGTSPWVVSGTVAVTQSTSPWVVTFDALGSATGGTAAAQSDLAGGIYNSTPPTLTNGQQASLQLDAAGNLDVNLQTPIPAGTNLIGGTTVYVGSTVASITNPLPVTVTSAVPGTPIQNYQTSVALAAGASHTFTYTVAAGHTFSLERVWASGSGKIKAVVQNGATTIFAGFNSTAMPNIDMTVQAPPTIAAAGTVNVVITNNDLLAFDVYVTIEGNQN